MSGRPNVAVITLIGCQAAITLGLMVLVPIMPLFLRDLLAADASASAVARWSSIALAAPGVGALLCAPFASRWCERFGYRRALLLSLSVFVASIATMALAGNIGAFIAGRLLQGASTVSVIVTAYISRVSDPSSQGRSLGWQESAVAAGALAGPVLGGVLQDWWSVRPLLLAVATTMGCAMLVLAASLREPSDPATGEAALPLTREPHESSESPAEAYGRDAMRRSPFADAGFRRWLIAGSLTQAGAFALVNVFALFVDDRFAGTSSLASKVGVLHSLGWLATLIAGPFWGARNDCRNPLRQFVGAALVCAVALALLPFASSLWQIGVLRIVHGASFAALAQSVLIVCCRNAPLPLQGRVTVAAKSAMVTGQLLGPLCVLIFLPFTGPVAALWLTSAMFVGAAVVVRAEPALRFSSLSESR